MYKFVEAIKKGDDLIVTIEDADLKDVQLFVFGKGSDTWEKVKSIAKKETKIIIKYLNEVKNVVEEDISDQVRP